MFEPILTDSDFSWMDDDPTDRETAEAMQAKVAELLLTRQWSREDELMNAAADALGNEDERYSNIYVCLNCRKLYHSFYSHNTDPDRDFCDSQCEIDWLDSNPEAEYNGDLRDEADE